MARTTKTISVGLVGCNRRALWYGAIFGDIDPNVFAELDFPAYNYMTYYKHIELQIPRVAGFKLAKVYDHDRQAARRIAAAFRTKPEVCKTLDEVSTGVDVVFIANESGDGRDHRHLATPALAKGMPTFVDRPLAATTEDAKAIISLARRKSAPLLSCSHMRMLPHAARFKARFAEVGPLELGVVLGRGPNPAHIADGVELALFLFGDEFDGRAQRAQSMGSWPLEIMHVRYSKPDEKRVLQTLVVNSHDRSSRNTFRAKAISLRSPVDSPEFDAFVQTEGGGAVMNAIRDMTVRGKCSLRYDEMLEPVAVMEAGRRAHNKARAAALAAFRYRRG